jgi:hypothetical protein
LDDDSADFTDQSIILASESVLGSHPFTNLRVIPQIHKTNRTLVRLFPAFADESATQAD